MRKGPPKNDTDSDVDAELEKDLPPDSSEAPEDEEETDEKKVVKEAIDVEGDGLKALELLEEEVLAERDYPELGDDEEEI